MILLYSDLTSTEKLYSTSHLTSQEKWETLHSCYSDIYHCSGIKFSTKFLEIWQYYCYLLLFETLQFTQSIYLNLLAVLTVSHPFQGGSEDKASACNAGDLGLIPGLGRSPGEGNGNPLQYSCLENPMEPGGPQTRKELEVTERLHFLFFGLYLLGVSNTYPLL